MIPCFTDLQNERQFDHIILQRKYEKREAQAINGKEKLGKSSCQIKFCVRILFLFSIKLKRLRWVVYDKILCVAV